MENKYSIAQLSWLVVLRVFIGWHFLYEGLVKVLNPNWSATAYLIDSKGVFAPMFVKLAGNAGLMKCIDFLNEWGLILVGLGLLLGCFARLSSIGGILLLLLYTMSHPSIIGAKYLMPFEGSYFLIDKNLVEMAGLGVLFVFPSARIIGIDRLLADFLPAGCRKFLI